MGIVALIVVLFIVLWLIAKIASAYKYAGVDDELRKIDQMSGTSFEQYCSRLLRDCGYFSDAIKYTVTKASGDFGVDIVVQLRGGQKVVVQCKRYSKNLGIKPIQEVYAGKSHYGATQAAVMTNASFTSNAVQLAKETGVVLIDRNSIRSMIAQINAKAKKQERAKHSQAVKGAGSKKTDEDYRNLPEVPYVEGSKEYIQMFSDMDIPFLVDFVARIEAKPSFQDCITLVSEVFENEKDAQHFSMAFTRHICFQSQVISGDEKDTWLVIAECVPEYKIRSYKRELVGTTFYEFANWG